MSNVNSKLRKEILTMRHPVWILNLSTLLLFFTFLLFISLYKVRLQRPVSITPDDFATQLPSKKSETIDLAQIYQENDLFNTYKSEIPQPKKPDYVKPIPTPPQPVVVPAQKIEPPKFLDPLPITLTGIFMFHDDSINRAIIMDNKSKKEISYKIGDEIEDAQLVKIFSNKVLLIRSNGQQEMLYLRQEDATKDELTQDKKDWSHIIKKMKESEFLIDRQEFIYEIKSLSNLIDLFDLTTAFKQGASIGAKVGDIEEGSLPAILGFKEGDIITKIADLPATNTTERLQIYKKVSSLPLESTITIEGTSGNTPFNKKIKISTIKPLPETPPVLPKKEPTQPVTRTEKFFDDKLEQEKIKILKTKEKFAPTLEEIRLKELENIKKHQASKSGVDRGN